MTTVVAATAVLALALLAGLVALRTRQRARATAARRTAALGRFAVSLERVADELEREVPAAPPPILVVGQPTALPPLDPTTGLPARVALIEELKHRIADAREEDGRVALALVVVDAGGVGLEAAVRTVADAAADAAPAAARFRAGEHALALVLDGGRADGLAAVARLEARLVGEPRLRSAVVELGPDEDAVALLARAATEPALR